MSSTLFYNFFLDTTKDLIKNIYLSDENKDLVSNLIQNENSFIIESSNDFENKLEFNGKPKEIFTK